MEIEGLENSTYYIYNPVWVKISELSQQAIVVVSYGGIDFQLFLTPIDGAVVFDIAKSIRAILPSLTNKTQFPLNGIVDGIYKVQIIIFEGNAAPVPFNKYFIIGGQDKFTSNNSPGTNLYLSEYLWHGWAAWKSMLLNNKIVNTPYVLPVRSKSIKVLYPRHGCESIMLAFRNLKGGFSQYLFEDFVYEKSNKDLGHYLIRQTIKDNGGETTVNLIVRTKAIRGLYETLEHLAQSEEIYYRTKDNDTYVRLSGTNNVKFNEKNKTTDVQFSFEVVTNSVKSR